eukprot:COSAG02_NODE_9020_length_2358_cov_2.369190_3_plen_112_part_00
MTTSCRQVIRARYKAVANCKIREGSDMVSKLIGTLEAGEIIEVTDTEELANGTTRVRFDRGWTSVSVKNGSALLELMLPTSLSQEVERELTRRAAEFGIVVQDVLISVRTF